MNDINNKILYLTLGVGVAIGRDILISTTSLIICILAYIIITYIHFSKHIMNSTRNRRHTLNVKTFTLVQLTTYCVLAIAALIAMKGALAISATLWFKSLSVYVQVPMILIPLVTGTLIISYINKKLIIYIERQ